MATARRLFRLWAIPSVTGQRLVEVDRLRDIVDRADAQALQLALLVGPRRDEDDGDRAGLLVGLHPLAHLDPVHVGHHDVQQHQVRLVPLDQRKPVPPIVRGDHLQALALKLSLEKLHVYRLVVDDQDFQGRHG